MRLTKRKIIIISGSAAAAVIIVAGGLLWHGHHHHAKQLSDTKTTSNPNISLNQDSSDSSGGLNVSGQASNLGQLGNDQSQKNQGGSSGNSSSGSSGVDPSSFAQYNKYQNNKDALFGDIQKGTGAALTSGKQANVYYKGWLTNGALIDQSSVSSSGQPQPFNFTMGAHQVIPGWEEGLYGMQAGGTRLIIIPPAVGYGSQAHGSVPANSVLVFEVQLLSVQ
ncbi:MAG TPA: FKBP-type peptidyl-prolyl cis-trans isomerase [Candidatus Saccharimonadales bacterium]|nr:FKBP-type peptidyl-prolyl cis-trans isomerase [Candidatus Saccharimonadales bacterium]